MSSSSVSQPQIVRFESSFEDPYPTQVVGESHYRQNIENAIHYIDDSENAEEDALIANLILDDNNIYDEFAVAVQIQNLKVGYLSNANAKKYRNAIARLGLGRIVGQCYASVRGGRTKSDGTVLDFGVRLDINLENLRTAPPPAATPAAPTRPSDEIAAFRSRAAAASKTPVQPMAVRPAPPKAPEPQRRRTIGQGMYEALTRKHTWQEWLALLFIIALIMTLLNLGR